jgi:HEAT repeat protein
MGVLPTQAIPTFLSLMRTHSDQAGETGDLSATEVMLKVGARLSPAIIRLAREADDEKTRATAVWALGQDPRAVTHLDVFAAALRDRSSHVRVEAARVLGALGAEARPAMPALAAALEDQEDVVRQWAAASLTKIIESR